MSGHSKWASIKHKKGTVDARRGKIFTKLIKEITVASRLGGGNPEGNPRLRTVIAAAKTENMPKENIERAIKRGTGELPGVNYEEASYEGYGPGGAAVIVDIVSDNKNRTVAELRNIFSKNGGNLGETGCVSWMFQRKGLILVKKDEIGEEKLMDIVLEAGAEDFKSEDEDAFEIITRTEDFEAVKASLANSQVKTILAEVTLIPQTTVKLQGEKAKQMLRLMELLEEHDDIQKTYANFDLQEKQLFGV